MEKGLHGVDHGAEFVCAWSPPTMSGGAAGVDEDLQDRYLVGAYFSVRIQSG